ncbi:MAG: hypothetical protein GY795_39025, partial [Desulfobacterales bacterium]|nr:hypothetical protein [Desulfobacterales bacterium]
MGTYYLFIVTDNYDAFNVDEATMEAYTHGGRKVNLVPETNDRDNLKYTELDITPPPPSDLSVASMAATADAFSGDKISVFWTVENIGENNTNASSWSDAVYFSNDSEFNEESATLLGKYSHTGTLEDTGMLAPGESYQMSADVNIPQGVFGDYYIFVVTDCYDDVYEHAFESNNYDKQAVSVTLTPPPDLELIDYAVPGTVDSGQSVNIKWSVENKGPGELSDGYWRDGIYLHTDSVFNPETAILIGTFSRSGSLSLNSTYSKDVNVTVPNGLEGAYYVFVNADNDNQIFEHNHEGNNLSAGEPIQINLSPWADLQVSEVHIPSSVTAGERVNITFTVDNKGEASASSNLTEIYISGDTEFSKENDILLTSISHTDLLPSAGAFSKTANVAIPNDLSGTYYIFVITDANDEVYEHIQENNNIAQSIAFTVLPYPPTDLVVTDLNIPGSGASGKSVDITYSVRNNEQGATLESRWHDR